MLSHAPAIVRISRCYPEREPYEEDTVFHVKAVQTTERASYNLNPSFTYHLAVNMTTDNSIRFQLPQGSSKISINTAEHRNTAEDIVTSVRDVPDAFLDRGYLATDSSESAVDD